MVVSFGEVVDHPNDKASGIRDARGKYLDDKASGMSSARGEYQGDEASENERCPGRSWFGWLLGLVLGGPLGWPAG